MSDTIQCDSHGERPRAFVCSHLVGQPSGLGFNRDEPSPDNPFPDAWCDDCEIIRVAHNGWNDESQKLAKISLLCSACYERVRIRNTCTAVTLDDLANLRWKCGSCDEWHFGPCFDFGYDAPQYWSKECADTDRRNKLSPNLGRERPETFLTEDYCAIDDRDFFVRGIIELPIIGTAESLRWGVWGSLSRANFDMLLETAEDPRCLALPPMFSWMSTQLPEYPDTLNLRMYARVSALNMRPQFDVELTDHPLAQEYHNGILPERVKEIMRGRLSNVH
jgi:hypothetical protein